MASYHLLGSLGCGSAIIELALQRCAADYQVENLPYLQPGPQRHRLLALNPTGRVPTLILPDDTVMSESAAILLLLAERFPDAGLAPPAGSPQHAPFLRWLLFLVAELYPSYNYADNATTLIPDEAARGAYLHAVMEHRHHCWRILEGQCQGPYFLGETPCALDLYIAVMPLWSPGPASFAERYPTLWAIFQRVRMIEDHARLLAPHDQASQA